MITVIKVGGSLYDLPSLSERLRRFLSQFTGRVRLFPGGGAAVDVIGALDACHALGEETCHWLALRMLSVNAHFLASLLGVDVVDSGSAAVLAVLDPYPLAKADEANPCSPPHSWDVTSDSLALRAAALEGAQELVLLKSVALPDRIGWIEAARQGLVDRNFPSGLAASESVNVRWINFRTKEC